MKFPLWKSLPLCAGSRYWTDIGSRPTASLQTTSWRQSNIRPIYGPTLACTDPYPAALRISDINGLPNSPALAYTHSPRTQTGKLQRFELRRMAADAASHKLAS